MVIVMYLMYVWCSQFTTCQCGELGLFLNLSILCYFITFRITWFCRPIHMLPNITHKKRVSICLSRLWCSYSSPSDTDFLNRQMLWVTMVVYSTVLQLLVTILNVAHICSSWKVNCCYKFVRKAHSHNFFLFPRNSYFKCFFPPPSLLPLA